MRVRAPELKAVARASVSLDPMAKLIMKESTVIAERKKSAFITIYSINKDLMEFQNS